jgi:hypothetical protein
MESELRSLIGKYGFRAVHEGLMQYMQETFSYLQGFFQVKNEIVTPVIHHEIPTVQVVKNEIPDTIVYEDFIDPEIDEEITVVPADPTVKNLTITDSKAKVGKPAVEVKYQKQKHREEVEAKRKDLIEKGVKPESLLTEENLRKWIGQGKSYQAIAKETGVHEVQVSNTAKSFGLQSKISRYVAMKKSA